MLEQVLDYIHNFFVKARYAGKYTIVNGALTADFLLDGQYYKIVGSTFNDGVHKWGENTLTDEEFTGEVWAMAVPPSVIALSQEIEAWVAKYGDAVNSPYSSESFGGYSYTKSTNGSGNGYGASVSSWQDVFKNRFYQWRKIA